MLAGRPALVAAPFWRYMLHSDLFPGGWLHDVGLPISAAVTIKVTKNLPGGPVPRTITMQAFQRTILTDDPRTRQPGRSNAPTSVRTTARPFQRRWGPDAGPSAAINY